MEGTYQLTFGGQTVGTVRMERLGLYYRISGRCRMPGEVVSRVIMTCGGERTELGILVPGEGGFVMDSRVAAKRIREGTPGFTVEPNRPGSNRKFVPIKPEEPFAYIERLKEAYLVRLGDQMGITVEAGT